MTRKSTWSTQALSVAVAVRVLTPFPTVEPLIGEVSVTVGGRVSAGVVTEAGLLNAEIFWAASWATIVY